MEQILSTCQTIVIQFMTLYVEMSPVLLFSLVITGVFHIWVPSIALSRMQSRSSSKQAAIGVAYGLPLPICSCGVLPVYRGLIGKGTPIAAAVSFLVATPELSIVAVLVSGHFFGWEFTWLRALVVVVTAFVAGMVLSRLFSGQSLEKKSKANSTCSASGDTETGRRPFNKQGIKEFWEFITGDLPDHTLPWILVGVALAAIFAPLLTGGWLASLPTGLDVLIMAVIGIPLYTCATGSAPLVAVLVASGLSPGAALTFLLTGPATNVSTFGILSQLHRPRFAVVYAVVVGGISVVAGLALNLFFPTLGASLQQVTDMSHHQEPSWLALASAVLLTLLVFSTLKRLGLRGFLKNLTNADGMNSSSGSSGAGGCH